jgi:L-threonylcarbamoyladenylate synthase
MAKHSTSLLSEKDVPQAAKLLRAAALVAFPTETVYGLGADATNGEAVAGIYEAKGRPSFNPLIAHVADLEAAQHEGIFNPDALKLARAFWPGPLTLVVPIAKSCSVSSLARAGLETIGLRIPDHEIALALLRQVQRPIAAPSANRSGRVSPTTAQHVMSDLDQRIDAVLDGGATSVGVESTIVACLDDTPRLLRPGGITREELERVLGRSIAESDSATLLAPGMMQSHYAPDAAVLLNQTTGAAEAALLDFAGQLSNAPCKARIDLSARGNLAEAAAHLFDALRKLDETGTAQIRVAPIPLHGLGEAINDRLMRAAAPRN